MKRISPYFLFILLSITYSCKGKKAAFVPLQRSIVILFESVRSYDSIKVSKGNFLINQAQIGYITKDYQEEIIALDYTERSDTAIIECNDNQVVIGIRYFSAEWLYFLFNNGDTIHVKYTDGFPVCSLSNRQCLPYDINYQTLKRKYFKQAEPLNLYYQLLSNHNGSNGYKSFFQSKYDDYILEKCFLDSIFQARQISIENYTFYKANLRFALLSLSNGIHNAGIKIDENLFIINKADLQNENMLQSNNYQWFLKDYVINILHYGKLFATQDGRASDSRIVYDSIQKSTLFPAKIRSFLLLNYLQEICKRGNTRDTRDYFHKFENDISDSSLVDFIANKYMINEPIVKVNHEDLILVSGTDNKTTLKKLLETQKGKVIVIDFWASWCAPCRRLIPQYKSLINEFSDQDVVFVFISIDKAKDDWLKASEKDKINTHRFNYLILATENSFTETIQLKTIPRSIIFDKNGILVCKDAPHPGTNQLSEMILGFLK